MRTLTTAQHAKLDKIFTENVVVGWHPRGGPIFRRPSGSHGWVNSQGRVLPVGQGILEWAS